jgi:fermentation-respiration switch protein FrsA (DUF1100 family)
LQRDPVSTLSSLKVPALVLRGGNDLNATHSDFLALSKAATAPGSASREFPGLNHEYQVGTGDGTEVMRPAQVAAAPIDAVAEWIKTGKLK